MFVQSLVQLLRRLVGYVLNVMCHGSDMIVMQKQYGFVMCNFAPPDMVGHTGTCC